MEVDLISIGGIAYSQPTVGMARWDSPLDALIMAMGGLPKPRQPSRFAKR
jgi:hypothetical protein